MSETAVALQNEQAFENYTFLVAGCVGEFWTRVLHVNYPTSVPDLSEMAQQGVKFGKALQRTNILRDIKKDFAIGRIYLPADRLAEYALSQNTLAENRVEGDLSGFLQEYVDETLTCYAFAIDYICAIPPSFFRLRLAALLPLFIGLQTIMTLTDTIKQRREFYPVKISRADVYKILLKSILISRSNVRIRKWASKLEWQIRKFL
jgi:farnesyl-diphosphate farnesyltransferase